MADPTKAELEAELKEAKAKVTELAGVVTSYESAGLHDLSWYQKEINRLSKALEVSEANVNGLKEKKHREEIDGKVIKDDTKRAHEQELVQYNQSEHTRFRLRERPSKLNIFGTPDGPVFDLGVDLSYFNGPVQIPVGVIVEMGQSIGMLTVEQATKLETDLESSELKNKKAALLASELTDGISLLTDKFYADLDSVVYDVISFPNEDSVGEPEESASDSGNTNDDDSDSAKNDGQADGDNSGSGSDGVSDDSSNADNSDGDDDIKRLLG